MDMQVQVTVGDKYGLYHALLNATLILNILLDLGLNNYNNRKISINSNRFRQYFQNITAIRFLLAIGYLIVLQIYGYVASYTEKDIWFLFLLGISQVFLSSILYLRSNFTALGKYKLDSFFSVFDRIIMITGVVYLFLNQEKGYVNLENFIYIQVIGYGISFLIGLIVLSIFGSLVFPKIQKRFSKILLKKSAPYALIVLLMSAYHSSDAIMIERMLNNGEAETSIYAQSMRILTALNNYAYLFAVLLLPMFTKLLSKRESIQSLITTSSGLLLYGVFSMAFLMAFYSEDVIGLCYGKFADQDRFVDGTFNQKGIQNIGDVLVSSDVFQLIIFGIIPMSVNYCFGTLITASGKMKLLNKIAFASLVLNIVLNLFLIPEYGAYGAALASLITQSFSGLWQIIYAVKIFKIIVKLRALIRFVCGLGVVALSTIVLNHFDLELRIPFLFCFIVIGLIVAVKLIDVFRLAKGFGNSGV
ncbi:MAG: hypothetical protein CMP67_04070 [Flavobacteriales bacterium]|nr:hypothetical protein [Flavobacteriales bacterium]|tara:strand:+ start:37881 stop:39302 length:1422 start_codon:yes stop_codon:yes gene_type:complete